MNSSAGKSRTGEVVFLLLLLLGSSALLLTHLTHSFLWNDEGSTALLARTILRHGVPMGRDGENSISAEEGRDIAQNGVYKFQPWMQFYVAAASFALLGESTFSARLPFALFGIATIMLTYFLARETWQNRGTAMAASLTLMLSVPFLLLAGQCRYYSVSAFFATLALWNYLRLLESRKHASWIFAVAGLALLHTNHGHAIALLAAVALHATVWHREKAKTVFGIVGAIMLLNLPWLMWMSTSHYSTFGFRKTLVAIGLFVLQLVLYAPNPVFPIAALVLVIPRRKRPPAVQASSAGHALGLSLAFLAVAVPLMAVFVERPYFRYLAPLLPLGSVLAGKVVTDLWRGSKTWTIVVVTLWLLTGLLPLYLLELTREYKGPVRGIVTYLNEHAHPGDMVAISYEDLPVKFYTKLRVIGGYTEEDLSLAKQAQWIIPRKHGNSWARDYLLREVPLERYRKIVLDEYPDIGFENRESPYEHQFMTARNEGPVVIYERVQP